MRQGLRFLRTELPGILAKRSDVLSPRMMSIIEDLAGDWRRLDEHIEIGAQRGVGRKQDAFREPDRRALAEAGERRDEQPLHAERGPVALRVLNQRGCRASPAR